MSLFRSPPINSKFFMASEDHNQSQSDDENESVQSVSKDCTQKRKAQYDRKDFEIEVENMDVEQMNNKRKKNGDGNGTNGVQKKKVKKNKVEIKDLLEVDDPKETNVRYENIRTHQSSQSGPSELNADIPKKIEPIKIRLPLGLSQGVSQNQDASKYDSITEDQVHCDTQQTTEKITPKGMSRDNPNEDMTIFAKSNHTNLTKINPIRIQNEVNKILGRQVKISKSGVSLRISCENEAEKKKIRKHKTMCDYEVIYSDPYIKKQSSENLKKGIIFGVDPLMDDIDICEAAGAQTAKRITKKIGGEVIATTQVLLSYEHELPSHVFLGWSRHRVAAYIPDPLRCYHCQRYGHKAIHCNGKERCSICSESHPVQKCPQMNKNKDEKENKCANCKGNHPASYRGCPNYKEAKVITRTQFTAQTKMTYSQAIKKVKECKECKESYAGQDDETSETRLVPPELLNKNHTPPSEVSDNSAHVQNMTGENAAATTIREPTKSNEMITDKTEKANIETHTNCVSKEVFVRFLREFEQLSEDDQNISIILGKLFQIISKLAVEIEGSGKLK